MYLTPAEQTSYDVRELERNARIGMADWLASLRKWDSFITLTYDPKRPQLHGNMQQDGPVPPSADQVRRHLGKWFKLSRASHHFDNFSVAAVQAHKNGWPHVHVLADCGAVASDAALGWCHDWYRDHGYARWETPREQMDVTRYVARYLTRNDGDLWFYPLGGSFSPQGHLAMRRQSVKGS